MMEYVGGGKKCQSVHSEPMEKSAIIIEWYLLNDRVKRWGSCLRVMLATCGGCYDAQRQNGSRLSSHLDATTAWVSVRRNRGSRPWVWSRRVTVHVWRTVVHPFVLTPSTGVHEEVSDGTQVQTQLLRDGDLHFFWWSLCFLKYCLKCSTLEICEDQSWLLRSRWWSLVMLLLLLFGHTCTDPSATRCRLLLFLFPLAGCSETEVRQFYQLSG